MSAGQDRQGNPPARWHGQLRPARPDPQESL